MTAIEYYTNGKLHRITVQTPDRIAAAAPRAMKAKPGLRMMAAQQVVKTVQSQAERLAPMFQDLSKSAFLLMTPPRAPPLCSRPQLWLWRGRTRRS